MVSRKRLMMLCRILPPPMADQELYSGLIRLHLLYHASREPIFGLGMIRELRRHGYRIGPGTLYPLLHRMEAKGYLRSCAQIASVLSTPVTLRGCSWTGVR